MNVESILHDKLKELGFDGLVRDNCGCGLDDLMPCEGGVAHCVPARKVLVTSRNIDQFDDSIGLGDHAYVSD